MRMELPPLTVLGPLADEWVRYLRGRSYSEKTIAAYTQGVRRYLKFAFAPDDLTDIDFFRAFPDALDYPRGAREVQYKMARQDVSRETIRITMVGFERLMEFLMARGLVDPALGIWVIRPKGVPSRGPQTVREPPNILSEPEIRALLDASSGALFEANRGRSRWPARDCAMLSLLLWTGMPAGELAALDAASLLREQSAYGSMTVLQISGDYRRRVPVTETHEDLLRRWEDDRWMAFGELKSGDTPLFVTKTNSRFTYSGLQSLSKSWCREASLRTQQGGFFRTIRRVCTAELEEYGARPFEIRAWFGKPVSDSGLRRSEQDLFKARLRVADLRPRPMGC